MNTVTNIKRDTLYITQYTTMAWGTNGTELEAKSTYRQISQSVIYGSEFRISCSCKSK
jgi:hypothetical protein